VDILHLEGKDAQGISDEGGGGHGQGSTKSTLHIRSQKGGKFRELQAQEIKDARLQILMGHLKARPSTHRVEGATK